MKEEKLGSKSSFNVSVKKRWKKMFRKRKYKKYDRYYGQIIKQDLKIHGYYDVQASDRENALYVVQNNYFVQQFDLQIGSVSKIGTTKSGKPRWRVNIKNTNIY